MMSVLQYEAHVTADEYLEFATPEEIAAFGLARTRTVLNLAGAPDRPQRVDAFEGRVLAWEEANAPGKEAYRVAMSRAGVYGAYIRRLPVVCLIGSLLSVQFLRRLAWLVPPAGQHQVRYAGVLASASKTGSASARAGSRPCNEGTKR
ncbi:MAG: transposase [Deltaproteobacteria bacterium]|nr:transposase [Deltaproteobacteria bacterium]